MLFLLKVLSKSNFAKPFTFLYLCLPIEQNWTISLVVVLRVLYSKVLFPDIYTMYASRFSSLFIYMTFYSLFYNLMF